MKFSSKLLLLASCIAVTFIVVKNSLESANIASDVAVTDPLELKASSDQGARLSTVISETGMVPIEANEDFANAPIDSFEMELIAKLQESYGENIDQLHIQASLIRIKAFMLERYPVGGEHRFARVIHAAFPLLAESILSLLDRLEIYNQWLGANQASLTELPFTEQHAALWAKRREIFGDDADLIWSEEKAELAGKGNAIRAHIAELEENTSMSLNEKLYQLQAALSEQQAGSLQSAVTSPSTVVQAFLSLDSVQVNLSDMDPAERQLKIDDIRRQSGFSEERIQELAKQDAEKEARWQNGLAYMAKRGELTESLEGEALEQSLSNLRTEFFKHEAITIEQEEDAGFWRFSRPRIYGVN